MKRNRKAFQNFYEGKTRGVVYAPNKYPKEKIVEFRVWDGEGRNFPDGTHRLVLLSNSDEEYIYNEKGLSTLECFKFLLKKRDRKVNVWFSFGYDVCKILTDIPLKGSSIYTLETLWKRQKCMYKGFIITYIPGKIFHVSATNTINFYSSDMFGFFQTSFIKACEKWGINVDAIKQGKEDRSIFDTYTFDDLLSYNFLELRYALKLITDLYLALKDSGLVPNRWHGPGALAGKYFQLHQIEKHYGKDTALPEMEIPILHAYYGGRIDIGYIGEIRTYQYDVVSAYPHALTDCISLDKVFWHYNPFPFVDDRHALYHVFWDISDVPYKTCWGPFPWRKEDGTILFPYSGEGWYWGVEVLAAEKLYGDKCIVRKAAYYPMTIKKYPLKLLIEKDFATRSRFGKSSARGQALKLILNSLYGKLCQGVGDTRWQNYIWGGYTTAFTRAKMLEAIRNVGQENVVAIATDGIFTKKPMQIEDTGELGSWGYEGENILLLVGAGLYTIIKRDIVEVSKSRGMPGGNLNHGWILRQWGCSTFRNGIGINSMISHRESSFVGIGKALHQNKPFGTWIPDDRRIQSIIDGGTSKRLPPISMLFETGWREMPLTLKGRSLSDPLLSAYYTRERAENIHGDKNIENEAEEE